MGKVETRRDQALRWVNELREECLMTPLEDLRPGQRSIAGACPITNSVHDCFPEPANITTYAILMVFSFENDEPIELFNAPLPNMVFGFVKDFDKGLHPDLLAGPDPIQYIKDRE